MRLNYRLMLSLVGGVATVSLIFAVYQAETEMRSLRDEVQRQALVLAESQQQTAAHMIENASPHELQAFVDQFQNDRRLAGVALYGPAGQPLAISLPAAPLLTKTPAALADALRSGRIKGQFFRSAGEPLHILALPLGTDAHRIGAIAVVHRVAFTERLVWSHALLSVAQTLLIVAITLLIVRWSLARPLRHLTLWLHEMRIGTSAHTDKPPGEGMFQPLTREVAHLASSLHAARAAAEEEARLRDAGLAHWTPERLRIAMQAKLNGSRLLAVSNREPYEHSHRGGQVTWSVPPSGLVTALEPVLRTSNGTWIAQATGDADRETADELGRLRVPPDQPQYTLRRVWLSEEEAEGFYSGFANEGLWPLCHIAHARPVFRSADWEQYRLVNGKFAAVVLDEMEGEKEPIVLVQDYHFALLPRIIKERRPDARVALFWHIPWPNPEAFAICPWQRELLDGMSGADLVGFHIQAHCNNFLETVDRAMECRVS